MILTKFLDKLNAGEKIGITSVCSANKYVVEASLVHAKKHSTFALIEATSNQVDQFGGYTGMTPSQFKDYIFNFAKSINFPIENIILGGDHLGPNVWQKESSESAMKKAEVQIAEYASAGFRKIHLDTSFILGDDTNIKDKQLAPEIITKRAAQLCKIAEKAVAGNSSIKEKPVYVIGTEVPIPGGAMEEEEKISTTTVEDLVKTIELSKQSFYAEGLEDAWERVIAVVVQPGVEFSDDKVFPYNRSENLKLINKIESYAGLKFEAHSTDYQSSQSLTEMVQDHFAILKVGPWLTFALREALFALSLIEDEIYKYSKSINRSNFREVVEREMIQNPKYWINHYHGSETEIGLARSFSYSDRIRYYWNNPNIDSAINKMINTLENLKIPESLISQYFPIQYSELQQNKISNNPKSLIISKISTVLSKYYSATGGFSEE